MESAREFKMPYGKYKGETLEEIYVSDLSYLEWMLEEYQKRPPTRANGYDIKAKIENCFKEMRNVRIY